MWSFFKKSVLTLWRRTGLNIDVSQKVEISEHFQSISLLTQPKKSLFFQSCATSWNFSIGSLMEDCSLVATKKKHFGRQEFTMSIASFGGIGKSEFKIKDRSLWLCNQVCLLECSRFCWHSDGTNQNWVDLERTEFEYRDIIHNIKTFLGNFRVYSFWCNDWYFCFFFQSSSTLQT